MAAPSHLPQFEPGNHVRTETGTYRVIEPLGSGGNSVVYLVLQVMGDWNGLLFAMKIFVQIDKPERRQRFQNEIDFLKENTHPAIMRVIDSGSFTDPAGPQNVTFPYVIAEYLPKTLRSSMHGSLSMAERVAYTLQLMSALQHLEKRSPSVVHRDIKPENIFIRGRSCILGDFGLLKELYIEDGENQSSEGDLAGADANAERKFDIEGSKGVRFPYLYPTPDLIEYSKSSTQGYVLTPKSDVFQLGLVLAELFTDAIPIKPRGKPYDSIELTPLGAIGGSNSRAQAIAGLINRMLEIDRGRRPSASDLFDSWAGIFSEIVKDSLQLDGRVLR